MYLDKVKVYVPNEIALIAWHFLVVLQILLGLLG